MSFLYTLFSNSWAQSAKANRFLRSASPQISILRWLNFFFHPYTSAVPSRLNGYTLADFSSTAIFLIFCLGRWQIFWIFHTDLSRTVVSNLLFSPSPNAHSAKANHFLWSASLQISILRWLIRKISIKYSTIRSQNSPKRRLSLQMRKRALVLILPLSFLQHIFVSAKYRQFLSNKRCFPNHRLNVELFFQVYYEGAIGQPR